MTLLRAASMSSGFLVLVLVLAGPAAEATSIAFYPRLQIRIEEIHVSEGLKLAEDPNQFWVRRGDDTLVSVRKRGDAVSIGLPLVFRPLERGASINPYTAMLRSSVTSVLLCYEGPPYERRELTCKTEFSGRPTTNFLIYVRSPEAEELAQRLGLVDDAEVRVTLVTFTLTGEIDGQRMLLQGRVVYDNTQGTRTAYGFGPPMRDPYATAIRTVIAAVLLVLFLPYALSAFAFLEWPLALPGFLGIALVIGGLVATPVYRWLVFRLSKRLNRTFRQRLRRHRLLSAQTSM